MITTKLKSLIAKRQSALHVNGKDSELYKFYRNAVQRECSIAKKSYCNNWVAALKTTNAKRWWKEIKKIKDGGCSSSPWCLRLLNDQNPSVEYLVQRFNQFLQGLTADFQPLTPPEQGVFCEVPDRFLINDYTAFQALRQVKVNKSSSPDPTPTRIWSEFAVELAPVVRDIYNTSMVQGCIPSQLKETVVVPIPKCSTPKSVEDDLRPIALTSQLAKVVESITFKSLFLSVRDQLDDKQFAIAGKSTTYALVYFLHLIFEGLDNGNRYSRIFYACFSKGFDLVDHGALLHELEILNVHNAISRWIKAFLLDRRQRVKIDDQLSSDISPRGGIPQGTKLAPLLFAILVNRLSCDWINRLKYVDDTTLIELIPRNSPIAASDVNHYASVRNMRLNTKKCKEMTVDFLQYKPTVLSPLHVGGSLIERASSHKLLGVIITNNLSWNEHCDYKYSKPIRDSLASEC